MRVTYGERKSCPGVRFRSGKGNRETRVKEPRAFWPPLSCLKSTYPQNLKTATAQPSQPPQRSAPLPSPDHQCALHTQAPSPPALQHSPPPPAHSGSVSIFTWDKTGVQTYTQAPSPKAPQHSPPPPAAWGSGFRGWGWGFRCYGSGFRVWGLGFGV